MIPSTGSPTWDLVLQIAVAVALLVALVVMVRNHRGR
jgi:low affinity Fe/Cu permease